MKETETITLFTKEQYKLFVTICLFSVNVFKKWNKGKQVQDVKKPTQHMGLPRLWPGLPKFRPRKSGLPVSES